SGQVWRMYMHNTSIKYQLLCWFLCLVWAKSESHLPWVLRRRTVLDTSSNLGFQPAASRECFYNLEVRGFGQYARFGARKSCGIQASPEKDSAANDDRVPIA